MTGTCIAFEAQEDLLQLTSIILRSLESGERRGLILVDFRIIGLLQKIARFQVSGDKILHFHSNQSALPKLHVTVKTLQTTCSLLEISKLTAREYTSGRTYTSSPLLQHTCSHEPGDIPPCHFRNYCTSTRPSKSEDSLRNSLSK